jgi:hypothetical protein
VRQWRTYLLLVCLHIPGWLSTVRQFTHTRRLPGKGPISCETWSRLQLVDDNVRNNCCVCEHTIAWWDSLEACSGFTAPVSHETPTIVLHIVFMATPLPAYSPWAIDRIVRPHGCLSQKTKVRFRVLPVGNMKTLLQKVVCEANKPRLMHLRFSLTKQRFYRSSQPLFPT